MVPYGVIKSSQLAPALRLRSPGTWVHVRFDWKPCFGASYVVRLLNWPRATISFYLFNVNLIKILCFNVLQILLFTFQCASSFLNGDLIEGLFEGREESRVERGSFKRVTWEGKSHSFFLSVVICLKIISGGCISSWHLSSLYSRCRCSSGLVHTLLDNEINT